MVGILIYHVGIRIWNLRCKRKHSHEIQIVNVSTPDKDDNSSEEGDQPSEMQPLRPTRDREDPEGGFIFVPLCDEVTTPTPPVHIHSEREEDGRTDSQISRPLTSKSVSGRASKLSSIVIQSPTINAGTGHRDLCIEGTSTGTEVERAKRSRGQVLQPQQVGEDWLTLDVIANAINLVARLEEDRQETLGSLSGEKVKVQQLGTALDAEAERRLNLLGMVVQKGIDGLHNSP